MSWIISHAISAVKSETPQVTASTVSPRALNACASKDQLYFVPPQSRARAARGASWVRCAPEPATADRMMGRGRRRPGVMAPLRLPTPSAPLRMRAPSRHARSSGPPCGRRGIRRTATSPVLVSAHRRSVPAGVFDRSALATSLTLCATRSSLRIAVGGSCVSGPAAIWFSGLSVSCATG